jgi:hypothetical protein
MKNIFRSILIGFLLVGVAPAVLAATFTISDVASHKSVNDCYMAIDGKVYDITPYFGSHPGGDPYLKNSCGTDATVAFSTKGNNGVDHSARAYRELAQYYIGDLGSIKPIVSAVANSVPDTLIQTQTIKPGIRLFSTYSLVIPIFFFWILVLILFKLLSKKYPAKINRGLFLRITSVTMLLTFLIVASGGVYMTLISRLFINDVDLIFIHVYFGFTFVLAALTHIYLHWKEIWIYIKKIFNK